MMLRCSRKYDIKTDSIVYANNQPYTRENYRSASIGDFADALFNFCRSMCVLKVDNAEYSLLTAIIIFSGKSFKAASYLNFTYFLWILFSLKYVDLLSVAAMWTQREGDGERGQGRSCRPDSVYRLVLVQSVHFSSILALFDTFVLLHHEVSSRVADYYVKE